MADLVVVAPGSRVLLTQSELTLADCETETLFSHSSRTVATYTKEFTMDSHSDLFVITERDSGSGSSTIQFQILNDVTSVWTDIGSSISMTGGDKKITLSTIVPNCPAGKVRCTLNVITATSTESVFVIKDGKIT